MADQPVRQDIYARLQKLQEENTVVTKFVIAYEVYDADADMKGLFYLHGDASGGHLYPWEITMLLDWVKEFVKKRSLSS